MKKLIEVNMFVFMFPFVLHGGEEEEREKNRERERGKRRENGKNGEEGGV